MSITIATHVQSRGEFVGGRKFNIVDLKLTGTYAGVDSIKILAKHTELAAITDVIVETTLSGTLAVLCDSQVDGTTHEIVPRLRLYTAAGMTELTTDDVGTTYVRLLVIGY